MEKIVKNGLRDCTVVLDGSECAVKFDTCFRAFAVCNYGAADVFVSKESGIVPNGDGVMCIRAGASAVFAHNDLDKNTVYLLGTGKVLVHGQQDSNNPFNYAPTFDGGVMAEENPVQMDGLQEGIPFSEIAVSGKNLLTLNKSAFTANGITATANDDGSITLSGTATAITYIFMWNILYAHNIGVGKIAVNAIDGQSISTYFIGIDRREGSSYIDRVAESITNNGVGEITQEDIENNRNFYVWVRVAEGYTCNNLIVYPQLELGDTATPYEQPIMGRELQVNVSGKNLLSYPYYETTKTVNGITFTGNGDGSITVQGTATARSVFWLKQSVDNFVLPKNIPIYISAAKEQIPNVNIGYVRVNGTAWITAKTIPITGAVDTFDYEKFDRLVFNITVDPDNAVDVTLYPQFELGDTATEYEPYHGSTTTIIPTSNPYTIPDSIRQVDGLNVVTVSEGEISVTGVRKNAAIKRIWDEIDEIKTAIIVSNGESE